MEAQRRGLALQPGGSGCQMHLRVVCYRCESTHSALGTGQEDQKAEGAARGWREPSRAQEIRANQRKGRHPWVMGCAARPRGQGWDLITWSSLVTMGRNSSTHPRANGGEKVRVWVTLLCRGQRDRAGATGRGVPWDECLPCRWKMPMRMAVI